MSSGRFEPVCGLTGCQRDKETVVQIEGKGQRAVCRKHLEELRVNGGVEADV